jgi:hypothetical protein
MTPDRYLVKKENDPKVYAMCPTLADAELLARNLNRATGEVFYVVKREKGR